MGHELSGEGIKPDSRKVGAVRLFPTPLTVKNVRQFSGLAGFFRRFIKNFADIAKPLYELLKDKVPFVWSSECQKAFEILNEKLCCELVLQLPDFTKNNFIIMTGASKFAIRGFWLKGIQDKIIQ